MGFEALRRNFTYLVAVVGQKMLLMKPTAMRFQGTHGVRLLPCPLQGATLLAKFWMEKSMPLVGWVRNCVIHIPGTLLILTRIVGNCIRMLMLFLTLRIP